MFFPEDADGNPVEDGPESAAARAICSRCALREQCLEYALRVGMPAGIWGGLSTRERDRIRAGRQKRGAA